MSKLTENLTQEEVKLVNQIWRRDFSVSSCYNHIRQHGHGCLYTLYPFIKWLYPGEENKEKRVEAMKRQSVFFNITPYVNTLGPGLYAAMEKEARDNPEIDPNIVNDVKIATMGPLAGAGDSIYWVIIRVLCASIAIPFGLSGSILGFVIFFGLFEFVHIVGLRIFAFIAYKSGSAFVSKAFESGIMPLVTKAASIMGMVMIGCMISKTVSVPLKINIVTEGQSLSVLDTINGVYPNLLGMLLALCSYNLIRKKVNIVYIMLGIFAVAIIGAFIGIF